MNDIITVSSLVIKYFAAGWILIVFSCFMVNYLSMKNALEIKKTRMNRHITARQSYLKRVA